MATIGAVYDAEPAPRRPHDIITLATAGKKKHKKNNKNRTKRPGPKAVRTWLTASVAVDATDVISAVFDQAEARDPAHRRTRVVLVDGANPQIEAIRAAAAKRAVTIHIVIDFIHVLQYLHQADRVLHGDGEQADTARAKGWPIATGIIEGAYRHLVADRLDITGAGWSLVGAEAVLKLRTLVTNGDLGTYRRYHLKQERSRNHQTRYQLAA